MTSNARSARKLADKRMANQPDPLSTRITDYEKQAAESRLLIDSIYRASRLSKTEGAGVEPAPGSSPSES